MLFAARILRGPPALFTCVPRRAVYKCAMLARCLLLTLLLASAVAALWRDAGGSLTRLARFMMPAPTLDLPYDAPPPPEQWRALKPGERLADARERVLPRLREVLAERRLSLGAPAYLRGFKESRELELWLRAAEGWTLFRTYPVAALSGGPGPKQREGDGQVPEGFYAVQPGGLNPASSYHLSFNIGYPNAHDLHLGRTGSFIMIHGAEVSIGCLAMTDPVIEEIYLIVEAALSAGQTEVPVHLFPFRMNAPRLDAERESEWLPFWQELLPAYESFESRRIPPRVTFEEGRQKVLPGDSPPP